MAAALTIPMGIDLVPTCSFHGHGLSPPNVPCMVDVLSESIFCLQTHFVHLFEESLLYSFVLCVLQARSLLTAHEEFTTLMFTSPTEILRPGLVFTFLKKYIPSEATVEEVKRMSLTADGKSAVFDVPSKLAQVCCATLRWDG